MRAPVSLAVVTDVPANAPLLTSEAFAPVLGFVPIDVGGDGSDAKAFLDAAVQFANEKLYGTLSATLIVDPRTQATLGQATLDDALKRLNYGSIGVNEWGGSVVFKATGRWGAADGAHTPVNVQSGMGFIGNARLYDFAAKTVIYSPFVTPGKSVLCVRRCCFHL